MNRSTALFFALLLTCISVTSVGFAADLGQLRFSLASGQEGKLRLSIVDDEHGYTRSGSDFAARDLQGLDQTALASLQSRPLRFALVREAGRVDCAGQGRRGAASGKCRFTADRVFAGLLASRGIGRPDERQSFTLTMVGAGRGLIDALAAARYPVPTINELTGATALDITPAYVQALAAQEYRPTRISELIAFKALGVTPAYIEGLRRVGYNRLSSDEIVQLRAMGVTPAYIASFRRVEQRTIPVNKLIEMKALGVTPDDVRAHRDRTRISIAGDELVRLKVANLLP